MKGSCATSPDEAKWRAESDHRTLSEAATIQRDPDRMRGAAKHHAQVSKTHAAVGKALFGGRAMKGRR